MTVVDSNLDGSQKAILDSKIDHKDSSSSVIVTEEEHIGSGVGGKRSKTASYFNVLFSGFALLSDGYQSGIISFVNLFLGKIYGPDVFNTTMKSRLSYSMFVGAIVGQLGFGLVIDRVGRKIGLVSTTLLVIVGAALSAASSGTTPTGLLWMMIIARGVLGVGVGGEYPCSSVSAGESADEVAPGKRGGLFVMVKY
jgi:MFS family permease